MMQAERLTGAYELAKSKRWDEYRLAILAGRMTINECLDAEGLPRIGRPGNDRYCPLEASEDVQVVFSDSRRDGVRQVAQGGAESNRKMDETDQQPASPSPASGVAKVASITFSDPDGLHGPPGGWSAHVMQDVDGRYLVPPECVPALERMFATGEPIIGPPLLITIPSPEDREQFRKQWQASYAGQQVNGIQILPAGFVYYPGVIPPDQPTIVESKP